MCGGFFSYQPANVPLCGALQQAAAFSQKKVCYTANLLASLFTLLYL